LLLLYIDHNSCLEFTNMWLLQCLPLFSSACSYLTHMPSFAIGDSWSKNDRISTTYMCTNIFLTCCWSILIIIHVLNSQICGCCNAYHWFAIPCSYLRHQRPSFALVRN
jgi:hypothetical protein